jgi:hypothetical protein
MQVAKLTSRFQRIGATRKFMAGGLTRVMMNVAALHSFRSPQTMGASILA